MKKKGLPAWLLLMVITLTAGVLLGATFGLTKDKIDQQLLVQAENVRQALVPQAAGFEKMSVEDQELYKGMGQDGEAVGYVSVKTVMGFGGEMEITVGTDATGALNGISVGGANFSETAGLGAKSKDPAFQDQFAGKRYPLGLTKNGGEIDAITAATITSNAVVNGVNQSIEAMAAAGCFELEQQKPAAEVNAPAEDTGKYNSGEYTIEGKGLVSPLYVTVDIQEDKVASVTVTGTEGSKDNKFLQKCQTEEYLGAFVGQTYPVAVDAVTGATVSSEAVLTAVNAAFEAAAK